MKKWYVTGAVSGSKYLGTVEADTEEHAKKLAWSLSTTNVCLCHQCSDEVEDPEITEIYVEDVNQT